MKKILLSALVFGLINADSSLDINGAKLEILSLAQNPVKLENIVFQSSQNEQIAKELYANESAPKNEHNVVLISSKNYKAIIDTGFAHTKETLVAKLNALGVKSDDITHVIITHSHGDHVGGLDIFKKSKVLVNADEVEFWRKKADINALNLQTFKPNEELIEKGSGIFALRAYGHTPGHSMIAFSSIDEKLKIARHEEALNDEIIANSSFIFVADIFHFYDLQKSAPVVAASFDNDKYKAIEARKAVIAKLKKHKTPFLGTHMPSSEPVIFDEKGAVINAQKQENKNEQKSVDLAKGAKLYNSICAACHGKNADTIYLGLVPALKSVNEIADYLAQYKKGTRNRYNQGAIMQAQTKRLEEGDFEGIEGYIKSLAKSEK